MAVSYRIDQTMLRDVLEITVKIRKAINEVLNDKDLYGTDGALAARFYSELKQYTKQDRKDAIDRFWEIYGDDYKSKQVEYIANEFAAFRKYLKKKKKKSKKGEKSLDKFIEQNRVLIASEGFRSNITLGEKLQRLVSPTVQFVEQVVDVFKSPNPNLEKGKFKNPNKKKKKHKKK